MTWQEKAKRIHVWRGARDVRGFLMVGPGLDGKIRISDPGASFDRDHEIVPCHKQMDPAEFIVDCADPATAREACAQLALFLGAPVEAVEEGVMLYYRPNDGGWWIVAGHYGSAYAYCPVRWIHGAVARGVPADNRPLAIATAWEEALAAEECEGPVDIPASICAAINAGRPPIIVTAPDGESVMLEKDGDTALWHEGTVVLLDGEE